MTLAWPPWFEGSGGGHSWNSWCEASKHESEKESHVVRFSRINCENSWFLILYVVYAVTYKVTLYRHLELSYTTSISNIRRVNKVSRTEFEDCNNIACKYTLLIIEVISCLDKILRSFSRWGSWLLGFIQIDILIVIFVIQINNLCLRLANSTKTVW